MDKLPRYIQVYSTLEFSRLVCALERAPRISFLHEHEGKKILSVQMDVLKEKPIVYYTPLENHGHYLCYDFKGGKEQTEIVNSTSDASRLYSPIVHIKTLPSTLRPRKPVQSPSRIPAHGRDRPFCRISSSAFRWKKK